MEEHLVFSLESVTVGEHGAHAGIASPLEDERLP